MSEGALAHTPPGDSLLMGNSPLIGVRDVAALDNLLNSNELDECPLGSIASEDVQISVPTTLHFQQSDYKTWQKPLFRVYTKKGSHPVRWDTFREYGPMPNCRWDYHPLPLGDHPSVGIQYTASNPTTALVETFKTTRIIAISKNQEIAGWLPNRPLRLLDLTRNWPIRNTAGLALTFGEYPVCQAWARQIAAQAPASLDGLLAYSNHTGGRARAVVLFQSAKNALPRNPIFSFPLSSPQAAIFIRKVCTDTGYRVEGGNLADLTLQKVMRNLVPKMVRKK